MSRVLYIFYHYDVCNIKPLHDNDAITRIRRTITMPAVEQTFFPASSPRERDVLVPTERTRSVWGRKNARPTTGFLACLKFRPHPDRH